MSIEVNDVSFSYSTKSILRNICLNLNKNELISILGPNGAGKSTLLKCMNRILKTSSGEILLDDKILKSYKVKDIAKKIGYVAQQNDRGNITVFDAIMLGRKPYLKFNFSENDLNIISKVIKQLNIEDISLNTLDNISGGELQKVSIARALVQEPEFLLLDEPTSNLDLKNSLEILNLIKYIIKNQNITVIITIHNINTALRYSDKIIFLKDGEIYRILDRNEVSASDIEYVYGIKVQIKIINDFPIVIPVE